MGTTSHFSKSLSDLATDGKSLIQRIFNGYNDRYGQSSASIQVYDTAWVAMVKKKVDGNHQWAFPESFHYILQTQFSDGSWGSHPTSQTVGILDTSAGLLALLRHAADPLQINSVSSDTIKEKVENAVNSLRSQLQQWDDVLDTNHIGVELVIPAILEYLAEEGLHFEFRSKETLVQMNLEKMSTFELKSVYEPKPSSILYSLEAFIGKIDFDNISHHLVQGSMFGSPSSTAAYLMHTSVWDERAEGYIRHIIKEGMGHGDGGIPGTYPITYFEYSWTISALLRSGFSISDLQCPALDGMAQVLVNAFKKHNGIIGFAPHSLDADDTAKGLLALRLLNKDQEVSPKPMIKVFERSNHFTTHLVERDPSLTTHCNILLALLAQDDVAQYSSQIEKVVKFMCNAWWKSNTRLKDKWHLSYLYPTMLLVQAFTDFLALLDRGDVRILDEDLRHQTVISLFQACHRTLLEQHEDGSWGQMPEQTAYAVLALAEARSLILFSRVRATMQSSIDRGVAFLTNATDCWLPDRHWTSKTAYNVGFVAEAYLLAASRILAVDADRLVGTSLRLEMADFESDSYHQLVAKTPYFATVPDWETKLSLIESVLFIPLLETRRLDVLSSDTVPMTKDKCLSIIPFIWVGCNNRTRTFASASYLYEMMLRSLLCFQTKESVEAAPAPACENNTVALHHMVDDVINSVSGNCLSRCRQDKRP